ncbi:MAG: outer membrane lipoprotein-sorting protein [Phaeodactylibacter sp.]|nr:outer membrane lipoprotein-sorting protein [Phaeodactylibacter sp.]MCB9264392.1 outer membrane lipoprotein-sorting protein [Lewinellaceae bacterium]MCB9286019.1 outer membrane lipoprotein-sorting protein [Lewinellaceae bacterium]
MKRLILAVLAVALLACSAAYAQNLTATEIIEKADQKQRGETSMGELKMTIVRPTWKREMQMKSWSKGTEYMLILVTSPARDEGTAFLKRENEIWNWQPTIDRVIKLPPSMMMQSWMGSDFTNDDLVRESSIVKDYTHKLLGKETIEGRECYKIELTPKENAPVVWGKVLSWIDTKEFMQMKTEMYDEDGYLVNTMYGKNVKEMDGRLLPSVLEVIPADEEGHKTIVEYLTLKFNEPIKESFFSVQTMKRVR